MYNLKMMLTALSSKQGAVTIEYVLVIVLVALALIAALTFFAGALSNTVRGQGAGAERTANNSYCRAIGRTQWAGTYTAGVPNCT